LGQGSRLMLVSFREHGIVDVIEGLEPIRRRPAMYVGDGTSERSMCSRLVESVVTNAANDRPSPSAVRVTVWAGNVVTVAFDGMPLPIAPYADHRTKVLPHPELYRMFMYIAAPATERPLSFGGAVVNALSERLVVWTRHEGVTFRASFRGGGLVSLLAESAVDELLGTNWLTFKPDEQLVPGSLTFEDSEAIASRVANEVPDVSVTAIDRMGVQANWV